MFRAGHKYLRIEGGFNDNDKTQAIITERERETMVLCSGHSR